MDYSTNQKGSAERLHSSHSAIALPSADTLLPSCVFPSLVILGCREREQLPPGRLKWSPGLTDTPCLPADVRHDNGSWEVQAKRLNGRKAGPKTGNMDSHSPAQMTPLMGSLLRCSRVVSILGSCVTSHEVCIINYCWVLFHSG